jgi:hypothetical protein
MNFEKFKASISEDKPPLEVNDLLKAMWHEAKGDWEKAHELAQDNHSSEGSWIHAYLHRKEGDISNASYWYARAGRSKPQYSLEKEWEDIVQELLDKF